MAERNEIGKIVGYQVYVLQENADGNIGGNTSGVTIQGSLPTEPVPFNTSEGTTGTVGFRFGEKGPNIADVTLLDTGTKMVMVSREKGVGFQSVGGERLGRIGVQVLPIREF